MSSTPLNTAGSVVLNAQGAGTVTLGPDAVPGLVWRVSIAAVSTSTSVKVPQCNIYIGAAATPAALVDGTFTGNLDSTARTANFPIQPGTKIIAVWSGGDAGAIATLSILGTIETLDLG